MFLRIILTSSLVSLSLNITSPEELVVPFLISCSWEGGDGGGSGITGFEHPIGMIAEADKNAARVNFAIAFLVMFLIESTLFSRPIFYTPF